MSDMPYRARSQFSGRVLDRVDPLVRHPCHHGHPDHRAFRLGKE